MAKALATDVILEESWKKLAKKDGQVQIVLALIGAGKENIRRKDNERREFVKYSDQWKKVWEQNMIGEQKIKL